MYVCLVKYIPSFNLFPRGNALAMEIMVNSINCYASWVSLQREARVVKTFFLPCKGHSNKHCLELEHYDGRITDLNGTV